MKTEIDYGLSSREVAEMVEKDHSNLLKDISRYVGYFIEVKINANEFFKESTYKDSRGRTLKCFIVSKKGCEFIAHKLTGRKGAIFTARYINRFHELEQNELKRLGFVKPSSVLIPLEKTAVWENTKAYQKELNERIVKAFNQMQKIETEVKSLLEMGKTVVGHLQMLNYELYNLEN